MPGISTGLAIGIGSAVSGIAGGALANQGARSQARAAEQSSAAAIAEQRRQFDIQMQTLQPWIQAGGAAVSRLAFLLGIGPTGAGAPSGTQPQIPGQPGQPGQGGTDFAAPTYG